VAGGGASGVPCRALHPLRTIASNHGENLRITISRFLIVIV